MFRMGLLTKTVLLLVLVFAGTAAAIKFLYVPELERRVREQMMEVATEILRESERVMLARAWHQAKKNQRMLLDLPYELTEGDADRTRDLVLRYSEELRDTYPGTVAITSREFRLLTSDRIEEEVTTLSGKFRGEADRGLLALLAAMMIVSGVALYRGVLAPIRRLSAATQRVAEGHLAETVGLTSGDEVGRLGRAFDEMTIALRESREEIQELNHNLAEKVKEKTRTLSERNEELREANERLVGMIEELKATRDALVHSQTMSSLGTLAGGVAHEFNNLLGGIIGIAEDAREEQDPEAVRDSLAMILRTARRACVITENLLRFSRPPERTPRPTDLSALVGDAIDLVRPEAGKRGIEVAESLAELPQIPLDPGQIHQVILNLLTNALNAMKHGGHLEVTTRVGPREVAVEVADDGPGVPEANRERIFTPFFTTRDGGTGLGLSVSYAIVRAHDGKIEVEARPGGGSIFRVRLPSGEES